MPITISPESFFHPSSQLLYLKLNYEHAQLLLHDLKPGTRHGNWATTECGGLYIIGTLFPECTDAASWRQYAVDRLTSELDIIVPPDGFEAELTPTYHFVALDGFRRPLDMAKLNNLPIPDIFRTRILGMYRAAVLVMDQSGNDVPTNDSKIVSAALEAGAGLKLGTTLSGVGGFARSKGTGAARFDRAALRRFLRHARRLEARRSIPLFRGWPHRHRPST